MEQKNCTIAVEGESDDDTKSQTWLNILKHEIYGFCIMYTISKYLSP